MLLQWIRHHILVFEERKFPTSYEEIEVNRRKGAQLGQSNVIRLIKALGNGSQLHNSVCYIMEMNNYKALFMSDFDHIYNFFCRFSGVSF